MPATFPGMYNTYIANHEATNKMVVDFSRNVDKFALPKWAQYVPVKTNRGFYLEMTVEMAGRLYSTDGADMAWADGQDAPRNAGQTEAFDWKSYITGRYMTGFELGQLAAEQASWDVVAQHSRIHAQRMMTLRTQRAVTLATTTGNYLSTHLINVASPPSGLSLSGRLDAATSTNMDIKRTLDFAFTQINKATLSAVDQMDVLLVMNPITAQRLANTQEIRDTVKQSPFAMDLITKQLGPAQNFGLPNSLYGYTPVIESTVKVTTFKGAATTTKDYVLGDGNILFCSRPGGLVGVEGAPSFSTFSVFMKEEMTVETKHDVDNRRHVGRVIDDFDVKMTAPISGVLIYNAIT